VCRLGCQLRKLLRKFGTMLQKTVDVCLSRVRTVLGFLAVVSVAIVTVRGGTILVQTVGVWLPHVLTVLGFLAATAAAIMTVLGARHSHLSGLIRAQVDRLWEKDNEQRLGLQKNLMVQIGLFRERNLQIRTSMKYAYVAFVFAVLAAIIGVVFFATQAPVMAGDAASGTPKPEPVLVGFFLLFGLIGLAFLASFCLWWSLHLAYLEFRDSPTTLDLEIYSVKGLPDIALPFGEDVGKKLEGLLNPGHRNQSSGDGLGRASDSK
jgi:hypothetical protein